MKKLLPLFLFLFLGFEVFSNPLYNIPEVRISELKFNADGTWEMELYTRSYNLEVEIKSTSGRILLSDLEKPLLSQGESIVISSTEIKPEWDFKIDSKGDSLRVMLVSANTRDYFHGAYLIFGDKLGAMVPVPEICQSIVTSDVFDVSKFQFLAFISDEPKIGLEKDFDATIKGKVYDKEGNLVSNKHTGLYLGGDLYSFERGYKSADFTTSEDGSYEVKFPPINVNWSSVYENNYSSVPIQSVKLNLEQNKIYEVDIHLTGDFEVDIEENTEGLPIKFYPNPVKEDMKLKYEINLPVNTLNVEVEVVSLTGSVLMKKKITENAGEINLPRSSHNACILNCVVDGRKQYSTKLLLAK